MYSNKSPFQTTSDHSEESRKILCPMSTSPARFYGNPIESSKRNVKYDDWSDSSPDYLSKKEEMSLNKPVRENNPIKGRCKDMCPAKEAHL